ncbi:MAG: FtsQ-type POTRA domain-containing protein [Pseudomonadota bacterium]
MWDKPDVLNAIAGALFAAALLLAAYGGVHYVVRLPVFPLREVRVDGELAHVTREQLETLARREVKGNFFTLDLGEARAAFASLPWVRGAEVRRQWPDRLDVALEEHVPLARWSNAALVNTHGEVFTAEFDGKLPLFAAPDEVSAKEIAIQYGYFQRRLATIGQVPVEVRVSPRRAWQVQLASGLTLRLGRERIEARLDRYIAVHDRTLSRLQRNLDYVDLRYPNGFAVRIPELKPEPQHQRRAGKAARDPTQAKGNR